MLPIAYIKGERLEASWAVVTFSLLHTNTNQSIIDNTKM